MNNRNDIEIIEGRQIINDIDLGLLEAAKIRLLAFNKISPVAFPENIKTEEIGLSQLDTKIASQGFEKNRNKFINEIRAIISHIFNKFDLPKQNGLDIGSGATGAMVESFLSNEIDIFKNSWTQIDISPKAVQQNKNLHPSSNIFIGSYHNIGIENKMDIITGLSSLDATFFIDNALQQIEKALKPGGYFVHIQDVRPGIGAGIRTMLRNGEKAPFNVVQLSNNIPILYIDSKQKLHNVGDLFKEDLEYHLENNSNLETLFSDWITARTDTDFAISKHYFMNMELGRAHATPDSARQASMIVTIAKKTP